MSFAYAPTSDSSRRIVVRASERMSAPRCDLKFDKWKDQQGAT
jgi:hypothetical protein